MVPIKGKTIREAKKVQRIDNAMGAVLTPYRGAKVRAIRPTGAAATIREVLAISMW